MKIIFIVFIIIFTSCTISKNSNKYKTSSDSSIVDNSQIKTKEVISIDTTISTKKKSLSGIVDTKIDTTTQIIESDGIEIKFKNDPEKGKANITVVSKPEDVKVQYNKTIESNTQKVIKTEVSKSESSKDKIVEKKSILGFPWWIWLIFILLLLIYLIWRNRKKIIGWIFPATKLL